MGVKAVIFDISGTVLDFGSRGPVSAFIEFFAKYGVEVSAEVVRQSMGLHKIDHICSILSEPTIAARWQQVNGRKADRAFVESIYPHFRSVQIDVLANHCDIIPGVPEVVAMLRQRGIKIANTTGFDFDMINDLVRLAAQGGYRSDLWVTPDQVGCGRPAPWMILHAAKQLEVYPLSTIVKVGDTPADIAEAKNAGVWMVAVVRCGNEVGLSWEDLAARSPQQQTALVDGARNKLASHHPHYLIDTTRDLLPIIDQISLRIDRGERP